MSINKIKKELRYIFVDYREFSLENRLLVTAIIVGIFTSLIGSVVSVVISSSPMTIIIAFSLFIVLTVLYYFVRVKKKFKYSIYPIIIISIIGISIIWVFDGGINGSNLFPGFVILILALIIVPDNNKKYVFSLFIASIITIYLIQLFLPDLIVDFHSEKVRWIDSIITVTYSSLFIFLIIKFLHKNYNIERERAEETEKKLREQNATKDKQLSIIAHELRSPFNGIIGFSEMLLGNKNDCKNTEHEEFLKIINSSAKNTLELLDNLLNWSKSQSGQIIFNPKKIFLSSVIQKVVEITYPSALIKNISLNIMQSDDDIECYTDEEMLRTVLRNLITNAIKFTKQGGNINVSVISKQSQVEFSVSDNGVGMNNETIEKLFDVSANLTSYGTANEIGSGLGLILCKEFVEKLGGNIWVESEEGKGSDFKFTLPINYTN